MFNLCDVLAVHADLHHAGDLRARVLRQSFQFGRVNAAQMAVGRKKSIRKIMRRADRRDGGLRGEVLLRSLQLGRVDAAQMAPARRAHVVQLNGVGASG